MYRGTPYLNRHLKKRQEERSMEYHLSNLTHIRPRTGTIEYSTQVHINNKKGELQKEARFTEIERENRILLEKISSIMGKHSRKAQSQQKINRSLNSDFRKRQLQNIQIQNAKLLKRLQQRKPNYETEKFKESWKKQKYVIKNLSNYPFVINDRKRKRSSVSQIGGKESRSNTIEMCRMRVIDGVSFLVTVRLNQQKMQIIGDTKDKKQIKVIEINRNQAIEFIEQECQGKMQKIFDCLRYDKVDEVLYLVANEVQIDDVKGDNLEKRRNVKREQNPQFDISLQKKPQREEEKIDGEIPIRISNGTQKYWVQVDKRQNQESRQKEEELGEEKNNQFEYQQFQEHSRGSERKRLASKQEDRNKVDGKVQTSVNTYAKIKKMSEGAEEEAEQKKSVSKKQGSPKKQTQQAELGQASPNKVQDVYQDEEQKLEKDKQQQKGEGGQVEQAQDYEEEYQKGQQVGEEGPHDG